MTAPLCPSCGRPLTPADAFCQSCGRPVAGQQAAPAPLPLPYGAIPRGDPFAALGSAQRSTRGRAPGGPGTRTSRGDASNASPGPGGRKKAGMIAGLVCGVLLVTGVATTAVVVSSGGDDDADVAGADPNTETSQSSTSDPSQLNPPTPSSSTPPSKTFVRTKPTGDAKNRVKQLSDDYAEWIRSIYDGDVGACDYMDLYYLKVPKKTLIACRKSAATPLPDGDSVRLKTAEIKVNGDKATVTFRYDYSFSGKSDHTTSDQPAVKKDNTWYFTQP